MIDELFSNKIFFTIVILVFFNLKNYLRKNLFFYFLFSFIGTLLHELIHYSISLLLNGKPTSINLIPKKDGDYYMLGYVENKNIRYYNAFFIALAPLLLVPLLFIVDNYFFIYFSNNIINNLFYTYLIITILDASIPSSVDLKVAFRFSIVPMVIVSIIVGIIYLGGGSYL